MKRATIVTFLIFTVAQSASGGDWIALDKSAKPGSPPAVKVVSNDARATVLDITVPGFWAEKSTHGWMFRLPDGLVSMDEGRPELPFLGCSVALPVPGKPVPVLRSANFVLPGNYTIRMAPKPELEGQDHAPSGPVAPGVSFPEIPVHVVHTGLWRNLPLASLQIHPFRARGDGTLSGVATHMVVEVVHPGTGRTWPEVTVAGIYRDVARATVLNFSCLPVEDEPPLQKDGSPTEFLVVASPALASGVDDLVDLRYRMGYETEVVTTNSSDPTTIKNIIKARYRKGRLKFVVLVGDYEHIPYHDWDGVNSDSWYACLTGGANPDLYPDVGLGRLSGTTAAMIDHQVQKILKYEMNPPVSPWLTTTLLAAHRDQAPGKYVGCKEEIASGPLKTSGWTITRQYGHDPAVSNATVTSHINNGVGLVNYRGLGSTTGWANGWNTQSGAYDKSLVLALNNGDKTPVVFNITSATGDFKSSCLQEAWLQADDGAVASLGAIDATYILPNHEYDKALYSAIFGDGITRLYEIYFKATQKIITMGTYGQKNAKTFWWGGDATMKAHPVMISTMSVSHPLSINVGSQPVNVNVRDKYKAAIEGAGVCLLKTGEVYAAKYTDSTGTAVLGVYLDEDSEGAIDVFVWASGYAPYIGSIEVEKPAGDEYLLGFSSPGSGMKYFKTFAEVSAVLATITLTRPIAFEVAPISFKEAVSLAPVAGASHTNTITFRAVGKPATIDANGAMDGLTLNNACAHFVFDNFRVTGFTRYGLNMNGSSSSRASYCTFKNCTFDAPPSSSKGQAAHLSGIQDCWFLNCTFAGGNKVVYTDDINRNMFTRCEVDGKDMANFLVAPNNSSDADNVWQNCFFHGCSVTGHGLYFNLDQYGNMLWHNTVIVKTSKEAAFMGSTSGWSSAQSWRNNIIVNLGTGPAAVYGYNGTTLDHSDMDYNCYHAPDALNGTIQLEGNAWSGTLAQWKSYLKANPGLIPAGGGASYDQNSIEVNPGLNRMVPPYDIHLKSTSQCLDRGTVQYVAGSWITYYQRAYVRFDMDGNRRHRMVDIGADELHARLTATGSGRQGTTLSLHLFSPGEEGLPYYLGTSFGKGPIPIDSRFVYLGLDSLLWISMSGLLPGTFINYAGNFSSSGEATAALAIPSLSALVGLRIHSAYVVVDPQSPSGIRSISNTHSFTIPR